ncbi:MAG TPA: hypothetical protein VFQ45_20880 [Longimicrobium sp.]|nr:hypothetical protein [Longimicrobium sp.]
MRFLPNLRRSAALAACAAVLAACSDSSIETSSIYGAYILVEYNNADIPAPQACDAAARVEGGSVVLNSNGTATHTLVLESATGVESELHSTGTFTVADDEVLLVLNQGSGPTFTLTAQLTEGGMRITRQSSCSTTVTEEYTGPYVILNP